MIEFRLGFIIVLLTALNVGQVAHGHVWGGFMVGGLLSWVWWGNAHAAAHNRSPHARIWYALGAACGTASGTAITLLME